MVLHELLDGETQVGGAVFNEDHFNQKDFDSFLDAVFAPPPKGTRRMFWLHGLEWRFIESEDGTLECRELGSDDEFRKPTEIELDDSVKLFERALKNV